MKVSHFGKMGDLIYALPVLRALARRHGPITLVTSGLCWQLAPILWEQPYIDKIVMDDSAAHEIVDHIFPRWEFFRSGEGVNLSLQPSYYEDQAPIEWIRCYMRAAQVAELTVQDCVALPSLVNHRRWLYSCDVRLDGVRLQPPNTIIVAPEVESLEPLSTQYWQAIINQLEVYGHVVVIGQHVNELYTNCTDLRGKTTVPTIARLIAESRLFVGAHSLPWHLARYSEVPAICIQHWREGLRRCLPLDTQYVWVGPDEGQKVVQLTLDSLYSKEAQHVDS